MKPRKSAALLLAVLGLLFSASLLQLRWDSAARAAVVMNVYLPDLPFRLTTGLGSVSGVVYDASTRSPLGAAQVCYETNCTATSSQGEYTLIGIPSGWRVLAASAAEHFGSSEGLYVLGQATNRQDFSLPNAISDTYLRIVLTWDATPAWPPLDIPNDLDANLWFVAPGIYEYVWYEDKKVCTDAPYICLENDVQDGYGPETVAILSLVSGVYHYGVLNVNSAYEGVPPVTQLSAVVRLYDDAGLLREFRPPAEGQGDFWYVFSMTSDGVNAVIEDQNCITGLPGVNEVPVCLP